MVVVFSGQEIGLRQGPINLILCLFLAALAWKGHWASSPVHFKV